MNPPIYWLPLLRLDRQPVSPKWALRLARAFWQSHEGYGHVVFGADVKPLQDDVPPGYSHAFVIPVPGFRHRRRGSVLPAPPQPSAIEWETPPPSPQTLASASWNGTGDELILVRPPDLPLGRLERALSDLTTSFPSLAVWLDLPSLGWDGAAWLLYRFPRLQLEGVGDHELWRLMQIARWLERPVWLTDRAHSRPLPVPNLPEYLAVSGSRPG